MPADVQVGIAQFVPTDFSLSQIGTGCYTDYHIEVNYEWCYYRLALAPASSSVTVCSIAYLANPTLQKVVRWTAERLGDQPTLPVAETNDSNEVLMEKLIQPVSPGICSDGSSRIWRASGKYIYTVVDPSKVVLTGGALPFLKGSFKDGQLTDFQHGIIDVSTELGFITK